MILDDKFRTEEIIERFKMHRLKSSGQISFRKICDAAQLNYKMNYIHSYPAKMLKYIPQTLLPIYCDKHDTVLDPFCGSGTVMFWSKMYGINSFGIDINPLARLISKVKSTPIKPNNLEKAAMKLFRKIMNHGSTSVLPDFPNIDYWFEKNIQRDLAKIISCINEIKNKKYRDFFLVCLSSIIRKVSNADRSIAPPVKSKKMRKIIENGRTINTLACFKAEVNENILSMIKFYKDCNKQAKVRIVGTDARQINLPDNSIDLVMTSPPYMSAQKYVRSTQLELYWLGMADNSKMRELDLQTIGTERVYASHKKSIQMLGFKLADRYIQKIQSRDTERAAIAYRYFQDMIVVIGEIYRVLKSGKRFVLLIGNNSVKNIIVPSNKILQEIAEKTGFTTEYVLREKIVSYSLMTKRNSTAGIIPYEWVLVLKK